MSRTETTSDRTILIKKDKLSLTKRLSYIEIFDLLDDNIDNPDNYNTDLSLLLQGKGSKQTAVSPPCKGWLETIY
jgi:hypothetical protein